MRPKRRFWKIEKCVGPSFWALFQGPSYYIWANFIWKSAQKDGPNYFSVFQNLRLGRMNLFFGFWKSSFGEHRLHSGDQTIARFRSHWSFCLFKYSVLSLMAEQCAACTIREVLDGHQPLWISAWSPLWTSTNVPQTQAPGKYSTCICNRASASRCRVTCN